MKTKTWLLIFGAVLLLCGALTAALFTAKESTTAEIHSDGRLIQTVDLQIDQTFTVKSEQGSNVIVVEDGGISVREATCPDHVCVERGVCRGGAPIVCLPNRLVIRFTETNRLDANAG